MKRELQGFFLDDSPIVRECTVTQLVLANLHHVVEQRRLQSCLYPMRLSGEGGCPVAAGRRFALSSIGRFVAENAQAAGLHAQLEVDLHPWRSGSTYIKRVRTRLALSLDKAVVCVGHCGAADLDIGIVPVSFWMTRRLTRKIDPLNERQS